MTLELRILILRHLYLNDLESHSSNQEVSNILYFSLSNLILLVIFFYLNLRICKIYITADKAATETSYFHHITTQVLRVVEIDI